MLIILDRDGVINEDSDDYIKSPAEWIPIAGSLAAIAKLNQQGHKVVIATNQSGLSRGLFSKQTLTDIHAKMQAELAKLGGHIDAIFYCPHHPDDRCECRKPKPGLFWQIAKQYNTDLKDAIAIGDALRDIQAANAAGCKSVLVKTGKGARFTEQELKALNVPIFANLAEVVEIMFENKLA